MASRSTRGNDHDEDNKVNDYQNNGDDDDDDCDDNGEDDDDDDEDSRPFHRFVFPLLKQRMLNFQCHIDSCKNLKRIHLKLSPFQVLCNSMDW